MPAGFPGWGRASASRSGTRPVPLILPSAPRQFGQSGGPQAGWEPLEDLAGRGERTRGPRLEAIPPLLRAEGSTAGSSGRGFGEGQPPLAPGMPKRKGQPAIPPRHRRWSPSPQPDGPRAPPWQPTAGSSILDSGVEGLLPTNPELDHRATRAEIRCPGGSDSLPTGRLLTGVWLTRPDHRGAARCPPCRGMPPSTSTGS